MKQSVWLEFVPKSYIKGAKYYTDINNGVLTVIGNTCGTGEVSVESEYAGEAMGAVKTYSDGNFCVSIKLNLWTLGAGCRL